MSDEFVGPGFGFCKEKKKRFDFGRECNDEGEIRRWGTEYDIFGNGFLIRVRDTGDDPQTIHLVTCEKVRWSPYLVPAPIPDMRFRKNSRNDRSTSPTPLTRRSTSPTTLVRSQIRFETDPEMVCLCSQNHPECKKTVLKKKIQITSRGSPVNSPHTVCVTHVRHPWLGPYVLFRGVYTHRCWSVFIIHE